MNITFSKAAQWVGRLMLVVCLMASSATAALAFDVSGTVSNPTGKSGRIYLIVQSTMYGGAQAGVSIPSASPAGTPYTIRGLSDPGSYQVSAFMDTQDTAVRHANDPVGTSGVFTDTSASGVNLTLVLPSPAVALQAPQGANVIYGDTTASIFYDGASVNNGYPIATSYNIYWSTTPNPGPANTTDGGSITDLPSGSKDFFVKYGLSNPTSQYYFAITASLDGAESAPVNANPAPAASGVAVSGTITTSGTTLPGGGTHLLMVLMNESAGVFITHSLPNPTNSQAFSISGVPAGTYTLYTIIDINNNGIIDLGDIFDTEMGVPVTVGASDVSGVAVPLSAADALPYVQTTHYSGGNYSLSLGVSGMQKRPVNVAVSGPQIPTRDLGLDTYGNGSFETWQSVPSRPNFPVSPDSYSFVIEYSPGGGSSPLTAPVTGIVDVFATPTTPLGVISFPAPDPLQFSWTPPTPPAYPYTYSFWLYNPSGWFNSDPYRSMPSSTTSINIPGTEFTPQMGVNYNWTIAIKDSFGNSSESYANFSAGGSGSISGMVTSDGSHGIANTYAVLLDNFTGKPVAGIPAVQTDSSNGAYYVGNVPPGNYKIYFSAGPGFQSEYYNDQNNFFNAQPLTVSSEENVNNINAVLAAAPNTGTIVGHVANASNGQPVVNAMVELLNAGDSSLVSQIYTTSTGDFQISAINPGSYKLRVSANGYRTIAPVTVYLVQSGVTTFTSISLPNTITYTSRVVDSANAGIDGALVEMVGGGNTTVTTEGGGYFSLTVPVSTSFYLRISKATYVTTYTSTMSYNQDSNTSDRPYSLLNASDVSAWYSTSQTPGTGTISGRVASSGNPLMTLPDATVTATVGTTNYTVCNFSGTAIGTCNATSITTNANGRFVVLNVPDGSQVTVTVTKGGYNSGSRVFPVFADSASLGRVGLQTSTTSYTMISKLINFTTGAPIANNTVTLIKDDNTPIGQVNTDSNGLFTAADLLSGANYYLKLSDGTSSLESYSANTSAPGSNVDRSGRPYYTFSSSPNQITSWGFSTLNAVITGTIKDGLTGQPIGGATISAKIGTTDITTIKYDDGSGNPSSSATSTSAANGRFYVYNIPASSSDSNTTVTVTVTAAPGYIFSGGGSTKSYHVKNGSLSQGGFTFNLTSPLLMSNFSGSVSDLSGLPLSGVRVAAYFLSPWSIIKNPELSDSTGKFTLNLPRGIPFALEFISLGKRTAYSQDIQISQDTTAGTFPLLTNNDYSLLGWPLTAGRSFIRGMALDNLLRPLDGVVVTPNPGSYTINYVNDADNKTLMTGGTTFTNGLFVLKNAIPTDQITLTASKIGRSFFPASFSHMVADTDSMGGALDSTPAPGSFNFPAPTANFGGVNLQSSLQQLITINNNGPGSITISNYGLTGDSGDFSIVPGGTCSTTMPATLSPGGCSLMISFTPVTTGTRSATLNIMSNATSGSNYTISLTGTGLATFPGAPSISSVNPWDGQATVNFNPPAFDGGSPVTDYRVTVTPGPITFTVPAPASQITVSGLTNGIVYAFWVAAINGIGTGLDSSPAANATPYYAPIRIGSVGYGDLETSISIVAVDGEIKNQIGTATVRNPTSALPLTLTKGLKISGGWNSDYTGSAVTVNDFTTIPVRVNIQQQVPNIKVIFKNVKVKAP